jgi:hypothetical protein
MWDNLTALQPSTVKEAQTVLFLHKLPRHIRNLINPRAFNEPEDLIQCCNKIWEDQTAEEAAAASLRPRERVLRRQVWPPPFTHPRAVQRRLQRSPVFLPLPLRFQGPEVGEGLLLPGKLLGQWLAHTLPPPPDLSQPAAPPSFSVTESATATSFLPAKNLIFLQDSQNISRFGCVHFNPAAFKLGAAHRSAPCGGQWQANSCLGFPPPHRLFFRPQLRI